MDEGYLCNTCRIGKVRPIHFSLNQAIVNCDNPDCDSYLEKWPWECIITRPILDSSDLSKYERDSTCSSDSSGVHSDLGSSSLSQYSITDREVENLLYKACTNKFESHNHFKKEEASTKSFLQWQFGYENQNQEPFVALDNNFTSSNEMSTPDKNVVADDVLDHAICNEANVQTNIKNFDFFEMLKESSHETFPGNHANSNSQLSNNLDNELESWLSGLDYSTHSENRNGISLLNVGHLANGENTSNLSPSKALIPSVHSAFSEVSPSKINVNPISKNFNTQAPVEKADTDSDKAKAFVIPSNFMSPASSGFSDDFSFNGDISFLSKTFPLNESFSPATNIPSQTLPSEIKTDNQAQSYETFVNSEISSCEIKTSLEPVSYESNADFEVTSCETKVDHEVASETKTDPKISFLQTQVDSETPSYECKVDSKTPSCETKVDSITPVYDSKIDSRTLSCETEIEFEIPSCETEVEFEIPSCETEVEFEIPSCETEVEFEIPSCETKQDYEAPSSETNIDFKTSSCDTKIDSTDPSSETKIDFKTPSCKIEIDNAVPSFEAVIDSETLSQEAKIYTASPGLENQTSFQTSSYTIERTSKELSSEIKIEALHITSQTKEDIAGRKEELQLDFFSASNLTTKFKESCRNETRFLGGLKADPWSVPEVFIDELNIEVVLGDSSSNGKDALSPSSNECSDVNRIQSEKCFPDEPLEVAVVPTPSEHDIYKPVTLKPEVIESESVSYFNAASTTFTPSVFRHSVGYGVPDAEGDDTSLANNAEPKDHDLNRCSKYFSSILSRMDFDENFCLLGNREGERSLEESISINYLNFESDSESSCIEDQRKGREKILNSERGCKREFELKEESCEGESFSDDEEEPAENLKLDESRTGEDSDTDMPIVTIDANDDLKIFIPVKKEVKTEDTKNELHNYHLHNITEDYSVKRKRRDGYDRHSPGGSSASTTVSSFGKIDGNDINVIDSKNAVTSDPSIYNVHKELFTMFNKHDNFGNIKKEPEYFDNINKLDCSDRYDVEDYSLSIDLQCGFLDDLLNSEECKSPSKKKQKKKDEKCRNSNVLKKHSYMDRVVASGCSFNTSEYDTTWAKPYSNLPSKQRLMSQFNKSHSRKDKFTNTIKLLGENPSVPEVLKVLSESGWAVTPCNPTINYNVSEHAKSPTIIPSALQYQYGNLGSDFVLWSLTDRKVSLPEQKDVKKNQSIAYNKATRRKGLGKDFSERMSKKRKITKSFNETFYDINNFKGRDQTWEERDNENLKVDNEVNELPEGRPNSSCLKTFKTKDGFVYFRPSFKTETTLKSNEFVEEANDGSSESCSDDCIELPDDFLAYEEAKKEGFNVGAPPTHPKSVYIPPPSPKKHRSNLIKKLPKENFNPFRPIETSRTKAQNELKAIVSRPVREVPSVVCMNIDGKLYVYHRKDS